MKRIAQVVSWLALAGLVFSACLFFADKLDLDRARSWLLGWTVVWFVAAPLWAEHKLAE